VASFTPHLIHMSFKAVSAISFVAEAATVSTANAEVAHISSLPILITQLAFSLLAAGTT
jgi:hypothetical protein